MDRKIRWGLLAVGSIARAFARGVLSSQTGCLWAVASRSAEKAEAFGNEFQIPKRYGSYETLLADDEVDAVYISTPHPLHAEWAIKAAEAGKHLLVEKPIGLNADEAEAIIEAALAHKVFLMEAYMYRCHPQTARLVELLRSRVIGDIGVVQATFSFQARFNPDSRLWSNSLGGGGILDVGGYPVSFARLVAGAATGQPFADPVAVTGAGRLNSTTGVDEWAVGTLRFSSGILATVTTGIALNQENVVRIFGTEGSILIPIPYQHVREGTSPGKILITRRGTTQQEELQIDSAVTSYTHEADVVGHAIAEGRTEPPPPAMTWADSLGNMRALDAWRSAIGLIYESEMPENYTHTVSRRPLRRRPDASMKYGYIEHLDKPVARLIMGVDNQNTMPHTAILFDDYFERGGNAFDTAYVYGRERSRLLGQWVKNRGIRKEIVVIAKGAHTPLCNPEALTQQLHEQLSWLGMDHADIYLLHRDNPAIPVGEFVDVLNEHVRAGLIKTFGGSNWTIERVRKANAYAKRKGLQGFSALSNNLALAEMIRPVWAGCLHVHDAASRAWLKRTRMPLLAWSSQARGFFLPGRAHPEKKDDPELVRCWYSEDNFKRLERAKELAQKYNVEPINIALAWVLCQPFPTFALIGPRSLAETRSSFRALSVELTPDEVRYLNLEDRT
ncbi:MAG: aldo/keto reductase [Kiritimatiellae bacterium]|nr:aldo/keto reductase [Kiritimatiellia bacterium]